MATNSFKLNQELFYETNNLIQVARVSKVGKHLIYVSNSNLKDHPVCKHTLRSKTKSIEFYLLRSFLEKQTLIQRVCGTLGNTSLFSEKAWELLVDLDNCLRHPFSQYLH